MTHPLDDPVRSALTGPHAHLAQRRGRILRYPPDVLRFIAIPDPPDATDWADVAALTDGDAGPGAGIAVAPPEGWVLTNIGPGLQLVDGGEMAVCPDAEAVRLGPADLPEITAFVARHRNGRRFLPRTLELGIYLGIRRGGALVAMAGERLRPLGWSELSAVCTDPAHRRQGLALRLVRAVIAEVRERGDASFLHVHADNAAANALYARLGFRLRREISMATVHVPAQRGPAGPG